MADDLWNYMPTEWTTDFDVFPEDFTFGGTKGDNATFEQAWQTIRAIPEIRVVRFAGFVNNEELEKFGPILIRDAIPAVKVDRKQTNFLSAWDVAVAGRIMEALFHNEEYAFHASVAHSGNIVAQDDDATKDFVTVSSDKHIVIRAHVRTPADFLAEMLGRQKRSAIAIQSGSSGQPKP